ncbi:ATP synthase subunit H protein (Va0H) (atp6H) (Atp6v0e) [Orobanche hederae]
MKRKMKGKALSTAVSAYNRDGGAWHAAEVLQGIPIGTGRVPTILMGIPNQSIPVPNQEDMWNSIPYPTDFYSVSIPWDIMDFLTIFKLSNLNYLLILLRHNFLGGIPKPEYIDYIRSLQLRLNGTSAESLVNTLNGMIDQEYANLFQYYSGCILILSAKYTISLIVLYVESTRLGVIIGIGILRLSTESKAPLSISVIACIFWLNKKRKNEKCEESKPSCTGVPRQGPATSGSQRPDTDRRRYELRDNSHWISVVLNSDGYSFKSLGSTTRSSTRWKFSYFVYTCSCDSDEYSSLYHYGSKHFLLPINKTSPFSSLFRNWYRNGCFFYFVYLSYWRVSGKTMWGTFWVWDARLTLVFISFLIYLGALFFQKLPVEPAPISIRAGPIDIPIIKSSVNWWNTSHQPGSISQSDISIHVSMPIPILSNFANSPFSTPILFVLETRLPIPSFLESPLTEEIEAREGKT